MKKARQEKIKNELLKEKERKKKDIQPDQDFYNKLASTLINKGLHIGTIYKLIKVKHIDQMLETMYETTVKEYNLHEGTIQKLKEGMKKEIEDLIRVRLGKEMVIKL